MGKAIRDIEYGMVFDHIKPGMGMSVADVLKRWLWPEKEFPIYTAENCAGSKGLKDIVKLDGAQIELGSYDLSEIGIIQPDITVNWIDGESVTEKKQATECIGEEIHTDLIDCANTNCMSHEEAQGIYYVISRDPLKVRCHYCPTSFFAKYNGK